MSDGNKKRDYKVFESLYNRLLSYHRQALKRIIKAILKRSRAPQDKYYRQHHHQPVFGLFDWAKFRTAKGRLKIHTVWDEQLSLH